MTSFFKLVWTVLLIAFCGCGKINNDLKLLNRFDKELLKTIEQENDSVKSIFTDKYSSFINLYYSGILGQDKEVAIKNRIVHIDSIISNSDFKKLYSDVEKQFSDMAYEEEILSEAIENYRDLFPNNIVPEIYTHVSPFGYPVITSDSLVSVSLDSYMGENYNGYLNTFHKYQIRKKVRKRIVSDIFKGWLYKSFSDYSTNTVIDGFIYEGAIIYAIEKIVPNSDAASIIGYSKKEIEWCLLNEEKMWNAIITSNHLYSKNRLLYAKYINEAPFCSALNNQSIPAEIGKWIGYRIVSEYLKENNINKLTEILNGQIAVAEILKSYQ